MLKQRAKELLARIYNLLDPLNIYVYKKVTNFSGPIPPARNRARVGSRRIRDFLRAGEQCFRPIEDAISHHHGPRARGLKVLDFGCCSGRVLHYFDPRRFVLYGCDVDPTAISFISRGYPHVHSCCSDYRPPLPYEDGAFDVIYSVSIWTHLPMDLQMPWLEEMRRILKPGGLLLITTMGPHGYAKGTHLHAVDYSLEDLKAAGVLYREYNFYYDSPGTSPSYGTTYHMPDYIKREWSRLFQVAAIKEGVVDNLNDLVVLTTPVAGV